MTTEQIEVAFKAALEEKAIYNELSGISEDKIYNWRKGRGAKPTIGDMLNVLHQLKTISIVANPYTVKEISKEMKDSIIWAHPFYESSDKFSKANPDEKEGGYTHTLTFDPNKIEE